MSNQSVKSTAFSGKYPEFSETSMSAVAEASVLLRRIAEPRMADDSVKTLIVRAARKVSRFFPLTPSRAEDIWRREARLIRAEEMDAIRKAAEDRIVGEVKRERSELETRLARLEALLLQDEEFHSPEVAALRQLAGRKDSTLDE